MNVIQKWNDTSLVLRIAVGLVIGVLFALFFPIPGRRQKLSTISSSAFIRLPFLAFR